MLNAPFGVEAAQGGDAPGADQVIKNTLQIFVFIHMYA